MSPGARMEYLASIYKRYKEASKKDKSIILDEFCCNCHYHRKHAIRLLKHYKRYRKPKHKQRGRPSKYNKKAILEPLERIWLAAYLPCSKRLKAIIPLWLPFYAQEYNYLSVKTVNALLSISPATIDRLTAHIRVRYKKRGRSTTKPGTLLKKQIPVKTEQWDEKRPGFIEADTIAHCGTSMAGVFIFTVDFVDIASGWTEQRAVWGKGEHGVLEQIKDVETTLPFDILGFDSDNGSEFLNYHLLKYLTERKRPVQFTRSRSYQKQDNCHIEQKNWTHVRQWFGYDRLDNPDIVPFMNQLYKSEWYLYHNFFCPSVKLIDKKRIASKTVKLYDSPKTPYQRIQESPFIEAQVKQDLKEQFKQLNPFKLRQAIEKKLKKIFRLHLNSQ